MSCVSASHRIRDTALLLWARGEEKLSQSKSTANWQEGKTFKIKENGRIREGLQGFPQLPSLWNSTTKHVPTFHILASHPLHGHFSPAVTSCSLFIVFMSWLSLQCNELSGWGDRGFVLKWCVLTGLIVGACKVITSWTSVLNLSRATTKCWARGSCPSSLSLWKQSSSVEEQRRRSKKLVVPVCLWHKSFCFIQIFWINNA